MYFYIESMCIVFEISERYKNTHHIACEHVGIFIVAVCKFLLMAFVEVT